MSQELIYTSAPRGLKPGSQGFCTVAHTAQMPSALVDRIESLSGYTPVFPPSSPRASENPVSYCHWKVEALGQSEIVVSRVAAAGLDYTDRTNKLAHHIVLSRSERPAGGPAWLVRQRGLLRSTWDGDVGTIASGPAIPKGDREPGICEAWNRVTGDAGWAGALVESFLTNPDRLVYVIYPHGVGVLELFEEAIALVPVPRRWEITFCTYLTTVPQGVRCQWRGVLQGTAPEQQARNNPHAFKIDLTHGKLGAAPDSAYADFARTGFPPQTPLDETSDPADWQEENLAPSPTTVAVRQVPANLQAFTLAPGDLASAHPGQAIPPVFAPHSSATTGQGRRRRALWPFLLGFVVVALMSFAIGVTLSRIGLLALLKPQPEIADEKQIAANPPVRIETAMAKQAVAPSKPKHTKPDDAAPPGRQRPKATHPLPNETSPADAKASEHPPAGSKQEPKMNEPAAKEPAPPRVKEEKTGDDKKPTKENAKPAEKKEPTAEKKEADQPKAEPKPPISPPSDDSKLKIVPDERIVYVDLSPSEIKPSIFEKSASTRGRPIMDVPESFELGHVQPAIQGTGLRLTKDDSRLLVTIPHEASASSLLANKNPLGRPIASIYRNGAAVSLGLDEESAHAARKALAAVPLRVTMESYDRYIVFRSRLPKEVIPFDVSKEVQLPVFGTATHAEIVIRDFTVYRRKPAGKAGRMNSATFEYIAQSPSDYRMSIGILRAKDGNIKLRSNVKESSQVRPLTDEIKKIESRLNDIDQMMNELQKAIDFPKLPRKFTGQTKGELAAYERDATDPVGQIAGLRSKLQKERAEKASVLENHKSQRRGLIDYHNYYVSGVVCQNIDGQLIPILGIGPHVSVQHEKSPADDPASKDDEAAGVDK